MADLITQQSLLQHSIDHAKDNFKKIGRANLTPAKIRSRITSLKTNWVTFREGHVRLLKTVDEASRSSVDYFRERRYEATEDRFESTVDYMTECLEELEPVVSPNQSIDQSILRPEPAAQSFSQLPKIRLPPFDGNYANWETFRDRFTALIIQNRSLNDFSRMHYLVSTVEGKAFDCICKIAVTADNFEIAWRALTARYENKKRILTSHFSSLLNLPRLHRESASELQALFDQVNIALDSLRGLKRSSSDLWNDFIVHIVMQKLDPATRKAWKLQTSKDVDPPEYEELYKFASSRIHALEDCVEPTATVKSVNPSFSRALPKSGQSRVHMANISDSAKPSCPLCRAHHMLSACNKYIEQNPSQRRDIVKRLKRCFNCLSGAHSAQNCNSKFNCRRCHKRHHSTLHIESDFASSSAVSPKCAVENSPCVATTGNIVASVASLTRRTRAEVLLATASVQVRVASGRSVNVRALIDQGSEVTFISESLAQTLRAKRIRQPTTLSAVGGYSLGSVKQAAEITISPIGSANPSLSTTALILPSVTSYVPKRTTDISTFAHLKNLEWADADPTGAAPIQLLIGADLYCDIIYNGIKKGKVGQPFAQNSIFGWIVSGPLESAHSIKSRHTHITVHHCSSLSDLENSLKRFWEIEDLPNTKFVAPSDAKCEDHFRATHSRSSDGRYIVRLPFKTGPPINIGSSRAKCDTLMRSLSRRFISHPNLRLEYEQFMREYENLGHMVQVSNSEATSTQTTYIPHHPVFRPDSATTRLRVVFNASAVTSNGTSLNEHLLAGPKLQTELPAILLQWRQYQYVYIADIAKMYRQILVDRRDQIYQRIVWQSDPSCAPRDYQLTTVTYGMNCAPFLALRVLRRLIDDEGDRFPLAVPILRDKIYVDDVLFGDHEIESLRRQRDQLIALLRCGHFELRKWASNSSDLLSDIDPNDHGLACSLPFASDEKIKVLGITWIPACDKFRYKVVLDDSIPSSKRNILSTIAKLYDPLGWVTPVTVTAKIFMQDLWRSRIDWDQTLPDSLMERWRIIYERLAALNELSLGRWTKNQPGSSIDLHGFSDASNLAYAAVVYLRTRSPSGTVTVSLIAGRSRVAPISPLTVPRLELSAALLLGNLLKFVQDVLNLASAPCFCWTDSTITLAWLKSHPSRWTTFVANRVEKIQSTLPNAQWRHVPTSCNPADCASRGVLGDELVNHPLWWSGPSWLSSPPHEWPEEPISSSDVSPIEEKVRVHQLIVAPEHWDLASRFSSWNRLIRVTAYIYRFIFACRRKLNDSKIAHDDQHSLTVEECSRARLFWIRYIQNTLFSSEIETISAGRSPSSKSSILSLSPFLDSERVLRVGGRLTNAPLPYDNRHPILLGPHPIVCLIVRQIHLQNLHAGIQLTLSTLRRQYWVVRARNFVKAIIRDCVVCARERSAVPFQLMGDLPPARVSPSSRCFAHCGVDYAGPVKVRASAGRGITTRKAYVSLFVCLATRAIHLELVSDCTTPAFINAFSRFCSRRGMPQVMYSDNGTTFVGADREIATAYRAALLNPDFRNQTASDNIQWRFIPPSAPHFGGLWEAGVRCMKHHLRRVLRDHSLTYEEFTTLLCQVEACLNSRPIAPLSDDFEDFQGLTPGHFLIGSAPTVPPEPSLLNLQENRLSRWQTVRLIVEQFWKLWASDYLNTLQQRTKWKKGSPPLKVGQIVLLRNPLLPPCKWELGRIIRVHPGDDGLVRVVTVKTATSEFVRPIGKICILPIKDIHSEIS